MSERNTPTWWGSQIERALKWRKDNSREDRWNDMKKYYEHRFADPTQPKFNLIYMLASTLVPSLMYQTPQITNTARRPEFQYWASFFDGLDNWALDEIEMKDTLNSAIIHAFLYNTVGFQLGFDFPDNNMPVDQGMFPRLAGSVDRARRYNMPWVDLLQPDKFIVAAGTKTMRNCRWFAKELTLPKYIMEDMGGFINLTPTGIPKELRASGMNNWLDLVADDEYITYYEVHDAETKETFCIDINNHVIMEPQDDPLQVDGLPLRTLIFNKSPDSIWGTPDSIYIETQMLEGNECRKIGRLQRKMATLKALVDKDVVTKETIEKLLTDDPIAILPVDLAEKKISDVIAFLQPHIQGEYFEYEKQLLNDAQLLTGTGPNQFGTFAPGRRTKFEAQTVQDQSLLRTGARRQLLADVVTGLVSMMNMLFIKNWKADVIAKVIGVEGATYWVSASPEEFKDVAEQLVTKVNVESMAPISRERRKEELSNMLMLLSKVQGFDIMPLVKTLLSQYEWSGLTQALPQAQQTAPMPMQDFQQQQQQMQASPKLGGMLQQNLGSLQTIQ